MEIVIKGGLGDQAAATGLFREYKRSFPDENIRVFEPRILGLWEWNPNYGIGNHENGKRITLEFFRTWFCGNFVRDYCDQVAQATGKAFPVLDDSPEIFLTDRERKEAEAFEIKPKTVAIDTYAGWSNRQWGYNRFAKVSEELAGRGWNIIHISGEKIDDVPPLPKARRISGLPVRKAAALLDEVDLYIGNDSGLMHLAAAVGTPQVVIFGVVPWFKRAYRTTTSVFAERRCPDSCTWRGCSDRRGYCMDEIQVEAVLGKIK